MPGAPRGVIDNGPDTRDPMPLALLITAVLAQPAEQPDLRSVMARAGAYVDQYQRDFSLLLADERYVQEVRDPAATKRRVLLSEFALVRVEGADRTLWLAFRDVVEVDGRAVRDRQERLQRLFLAPPADVLAQARAIALESARYNVGDVTRTVNVPTLALEFLESAAQKRSRFKKAGEETVQGARAWLVSFEERARPSLIRTPGGQDVRTKGLAWIDPRTGRVLKTRLDPQVRRGVTARIITIYAPDERLQLWVPIGMEDLYETPSGTLACEATYTNFRRFETEVKLLGIK
jgi:hypothetical protein